MAEKHSDIPFERYADDAICHCRSEEQALALREALETRLAACKLELHPQKTKIVYCKDDNRGRSQRCGSQSDAPNDAPLETASS
jgi:RNA-directed DNA polymerase